MGVIPQSPSRQPVVIELRGEYDIATRAELSHVLQAARSADDVVLDLSLLLYIDSSGIDEMIRLYRAVSVHGGRVKLVVATQAMRRLMSIAGLTAYMPVFERVVDALEGAEPRA